MSESASRLLHRLTSFRPGSDWDEPSDDPRVVQGLVTNDVGRRPRFYKDYPTDLPRVALRRDLPTLPPAASVLAGTAGAPRVVVDPDALSPLLYLSAGITRVMERPGLRHPMRAAGSAGGRFPLEVYLAIPPGTQSADVVPGIYWYHPEDHALVRIGPPPTEGTAPALVVTGVPWRTGWRYRERGWRHIYWDAGTLLSHVLAVADGAGLPARLYTRFPDAIVTDLVGADGVHEFPVAVVALGDGAPALRAGGPAAAGRLDDDAITFPLVTAAQRAGDNDALGAPLPRGAAAGGALAAANVADASLETVLLARSSQRRMDPHRGMVRPDVEAAMAVAMRGVDVPHYLVINDVSGLQPGVYRWPDLDSPLRTGLLRAELYRASIEQGLPRDAAFVAISAISAEQVDDHGYRHAQLLAGLVEGRLHVIAHTMGAGANGMTFRDPDVPALLGVDGTDGTDGTELICLLWTCVGIPAYTPKPGGPPAAPASFRMVQPRMDDGPDVPAQPNSTP